MKEKIIKILREFSGGADFAVAVPEKENFGHYSSNLAMILAKREKKNPLELAEELVQKTSAAAPAGFFQKVEAAAPGFINFWISAEALQEELKNTWGLREYGYGNGKGMEGKTVMVEFTDPNPFKLFHIGHLMSNAIGESLSRLFKASGAKVIRANYQGDIGLHVAKAIWAVKRGGNWDDMLVSGIAYSIGNKAYETDEKSKQEIIEINKKLYDKSDPDINALYEDGLKASLAYFERIYKRLDAGFEKYFFESEVAGEGLKIIAQHPEIFVKSDGATIFNGEEYGLHTRVFVNTLGLPTYEAKELGLNGRKFELYPSLDLSVIVTGNEVIDYFKVLLRVMGIVLPEVAAKTRHVPHGMMRLPSGKMSSRTGDVITADDLLERAKSGLRQYVTDEDKLQGEDREAANEAIAVGAVKYSILKHSPGQDIIFDFDKSLSFTGDSGPYLQYTYARLKSILRNEYVKLDLFENGAEKFLVGEHELALMRKIFEFPDEVARSAETMQPSNLANYLYKLAVLANRFYETTPVLKEENAKRRAALLELTSVTGEVLGRGLDFLGIRAIEVI